MLSPRHTVSYCALALVGFSTTNNHFVGLKPAWGTTSGLHTVCEPGILGLCPATTCCQAAVYQHAVAVVVRLMSRAAA